MGLLQVVTGWGTANGALQVSRCGRGATGGEGAASEIAEKEENSGCCK